MKMKLFGLTETKLVHFHGIFKNWGRGGGSSEQPPEAPLDPPLNVLCVLKVLYQTFRALKAHIDFSILIIYV